MPIENSEELHDAFAFRGDRHEHRSFPLISLRRLPPPLAALRRPGVVVWRDVRKRIPPPYAEHHFYLLFQLVRAGPVALIDHIQVRNFHYPRFQGLDAVARFWNEDQDCRFGGGRHVELGLTHSDGFDENAIEAERLEDVGDLFGRRREATLGAPGRHRANEHARIETDGFHPNAIAQQRAAGKRTRRIDGDHADLEAAFAIGADQLFGERALSRARRSRDPDALGLSLADPGM